MDAKTLKKGPFTIIDGKPQDAHLFKDEMTLEAENRVDKIFFMKEVNKRAKQEKLKRQLKEATQNLLSDILLG